LIEQSAITSVVIMPLIADRPPTETPIFDPPLPEEAAAKLPVQADAVAKASKLIPNDSPVFVPARSWFTFL
jgi:hypothetical protein